MIKACVIGDPIAHSLSPKLHTHWLNRYQIDGSYAAQKVSSNELATAIERFKEEGFAGFNVTIPHKEAILPLLDEIDEIATQIGAVNTVVIRNNKTYGTNTDAFGFIENVRIHVKAHKLSEEKIFSRPVVLGAGGAARAVVKALADDGAEQIFIIARNPEKAASLNAITTKLKIIAWEKLPEVLLQASLLVNTTPIGMEGKEQSLISLTGLPQDAAVTDIVYTPLITPLLLEAKARGHVIIDGLGMLIFQAIPGFEAWFGKKINCSFDDVTELKQQLVSV